jgi:hypothetical protein
MTCPPSQWALPSALALAAASRIVMAITKSPVWPRSVSGLTVAPEGVERVSPRQRPDHPFAGAMETTMNKSNDVEPTRELTEAEVDAVSGGWFAFHATAEAIDAVAKALATMAQKQ